MATIANLKQRITELLSRVGKYSIAKTDIFGLLGDMVDRQQDTERNMANLSIRKIYASVADMNADIAGPVGDDGEPILPGQLVVIENTSSEEENASVYRYSGDAWEYLCKIGDLSEKVNISDINLSEKSKYFHVEMDSEGKIIFGIRKDGYVTIPLGILEVTAALASKVDSVSGKGLIDTGYSSMVNQIETNKWVHVFVDSVGKILFGIKKDGSLSGKTVDGLKLQINSLENTTANFSKILESLENIRNEIGTREDRVTNILESEEKEYNDLFSEHEKIESDSPLNGYSEVEEDKNGNLIHAVTTGGIHIYSQLALLGTDGKLYKLSVDPSGELNVINITL